LPDDLFALVLTAIDQPQAAGRMLATCRRVRALVALAGPGTPGPSAPIVVQVVITSAHRSPAPAGPTDRGFTRGRLELAAARGWVELLPGLVAG